MERIRRSIRESFRRRPKERNHRAGSLVDSSNPAQPGASGLNGTSTKVELWLPDEAAVREGTCSFNVKYLGGIEVFESRGMQVCEGALKRLRAQRRHPVKAVLYVSGDGLRVVDQENNRGLIVDQTIEKVSFCAPDRNHDKGFAYICRDGSSRRWMCHGFLATKESGERLSHAVGCAFAVCLEKKKKRDEEATLAVQAAADLLPQTGGDRASTSLGFTLKALSSTTSPPKYDFSPCGLGESSQNGRFERSNQAYSSFRRQLSITDRIRDPQTAILQEQPAKSQVASTLHITPKPRPASNPLLFERQFYNAASFSKGSLRAPSSAESFRRQFSLRSYSSDYSTQFKNRFGNGNKRSNEPIFESDEDTVWAEKTSSQAVVPSIRNCDLRQTNGFQRGNSSLEQTGAAQSVRTRADEWLEQTLKTSLSISSSLKNVETNTISQPGTRPEPLPNQSPSPLPPNSFMSTPKTNIFGNSAWPTKRFDPNFMEYPHPLVETYHPATKAQLNTEQLSLTGGVDLFGQPVFNPLPSSAIKGVKESQSNGSLNNYLEEKSSEFDPFDVKWSEVVMKSASSCQQTSASTNPFLNELNAVKS